MTEPIKLPEMAFKLCAGIKDLGQYNDIRDYAALAVEQATAEAREKLAESEKAADMIAEVRDAYKKTCASLREGMLAWQNAGIDLGKQLKKAEAERDEARADVDSLKKHVRHLFQANNENAAQLLSIKQERDELQAKLDRLTTLRPEGEWDKTSRVFWWFKDDDGAWRCADRRNINLSTHWTPLPEVKEEK